MSNEEQGPGLLVTNVLWPVLHPIRTFKSVWMWAFMPVKPPTFFAITALVLAVAMVLSFGLTLRLLPIIGGQHSVGLGAGTVAIWFVTMLIGLAGDLNGNLHPNDLYVKSLLTAPFWCLLGLFVYSLF
jgi:hypothetical protein